MVAVMCFFSSAISGARSKKNAVTKKEGRDKKEDNNHKEEDGAQEEEDGHQEEGHEDGRQAAEPKGPLKEEARIFRVMEGNMEMA